MNRGDLISLPLSREAEYGTSTVLLLGYDICFFCFFWGAMGNGDRLAVIR